MSFVTSATDVAIEEDLKQFIIILLIALGAASLPKIVPGNLPQVCPSGPVKKFFTTDDAKNSRGLRR